MLGMASTLGAVTALIAGAGLFVAGWAVGAWLLILTPSVKTARRLGLLDAKVQVIDNTEHARAAWIRQSCGQ